MMRKDIINELKIFLNNISSCIMIPPNVIHPLDVAKANEAISLIAKEIETSQPKISKNLMQVKDLLFRYNINSTVNPNYAEAAVNAFIEINARVKKLYQIKCPGNPAVPDGVAAMNAVFSDKNALIEVCDRTTETGENIHNGTRFMLVGAMSSLRNPKSHSNDERLTVTKADAMRRLMFASLLMYKIDDAVKYSGTIE